MACKTRRKKQNLAEFHDESPLCLDHPHEQRDDHRVAPEYAPEYVEAGAEGLHGGEDVDGDAERGGGGGDDIKAAAHDEERVGPGPRGAPPPRRVPAAGELLLRLRRGAAASRRRRGPLGHG